MLRYIESIYTSQSDGVAVLELAILGLLKEQPLHGYELKKRLGDTLGFLWGVSYGSLYPALRRLERTGAIEIVAQRSAAPAPAPMPATGSIDGETAAARLRRLPKATRRTRKQYRLTPRGEELFSELLTAEDAPGADEEKSFALKFAFCRHLAGDARLALLERRRAGLDERLAEARGTTPHRGDRYLRSLAEHRTESTAREVAWLEELIAVERRAIHPEQSQEGATAS
ncbi:MAG TPA: PadR family transcriptional regulator [Acidimicrobiia bacterium]